MTRSACVCGHAHEAHEHYRSGSDCALCGAGSCRRYHPVDGWGARLGRLLHPSAAADGPTAAVPAAPAEKPCPAEPGQAEPGQAARAS